MFIKNNKKYLNIINNKEIYTIFILNIIFSLRMLGIFMILPVISTYGMKLIDANASLIGIAIGIYGITQIIFQIPFGLASDIIGRKLIIMIGLLISAIGTIIAAITNTIWGVIIGRALQGASAISGTLIALVSDLIEEKNKTTTMMIIGINFSITFAISIILGPIITNTIGLQGLFWSITFLTLSGIVLLYYLPSPNDNTTTHCRSKITIDYKLIQILTQPQLIKINCSIFFLHLILVLNFITLPQIMIFLKLLPYEQSKIYCISTLLSLCISPILILYFEKKRSIKKLLMISIYILLLSETFLLYITNNFTCFLLGILLFFTAFNLMEGILPAILIKETIITHKGIISGIFSTSQFLGTTCGGILGGYLLNQYNTQIIFFLEITVTTIWIIIIFSLKEPPHTK